MVEAEGLLSESLARLVSTDNFFEKRVFLFARTKLATAFFIWGEGCITRFLLRERLAGPCLCLYKRN